MPELPVEPIAPEIAAYYARAPEEQRLTRGPSQLEFARTQELIRRWAPAPPAVVLDVGGGPGLYSAWLAESGYLVHLLDPVPRLVSEAARRSAALSHPITSCRVGDARALSHEAESADVVLLLGPLYHLQDPDDRAHALGEARRVLRPGGLLFAAGISRFASALDGLVRDLLRDAAFREIVERDLATGRHHNPTARLDYFTTAYFHRPDELGDEIRQAGFESLGVYGLEGPCWLLQDFERRWQDSEGREWLLRMARALESEPSVVGVSAHLLGVGRRRDG